MLEHLVKMAQSGDKEAFVELIELNKSSLIRAGRAILSNDEDVADSMQDTVFSAYKKIYSLKEPKYFKTWLTRIMIYSCYDTLRKQKKTSSVEKIERNHEGSANIVEDSIVDVHSTLDLMKENDSLILTLFYLEDLSVKEISQIMKISENAAKLRLSRSRERFKAIYMEREEYTQ